MTIPSTVSQEEWDMFLAETEEQLEGLEAATLRLEQGETDPDLVREMFRLAHTVKGSAAAVGLEAMTRLTHSMETLLVRLRDGEIEVTSPLVDALLQGCDLLHRLLLLPMQPEGTEEPPCELLISRLEALATAEPRAGDRAVPDNRSAGPGNPSGQAPSGVAVSAVPSRPTALGSVPPSRLAAEGADVDSSGGSAGSVRIDVQRLDTLMELVGELVIDRERIDRITERWQAASPRTGILRAELSDVSLHLRRTLDELRDEVLQSRMVPLWSVLRRLPRVVRDVARDRGKLVELQTRGDETELDRAVVDELADPLIHLVRNSVDHGIEPPDVRRDLGKPPTGLISISARPDENQILLELRDDGRGIDVDRIRQVAMARGLMTSEAAQRAAASDLLDLIFLPGFSTARTVTEVSGRGVGMDIVRSRIERVSGSITVTSEPGEGTLFVIRLPLTLAIIRGLLVLLRGHPHAIPLTAVAEVLRISRDDVRSVGRRPAIELRGEVLPLVWLDELLGLPPREPDDGPLVAAAVRAGGRRVGLVVDGLVGEQDIVIKPIGSFIGKARGIAGATILVDGRVCPILNVPGLLAASALAARGDESAIPAITGEGRV